MEKYTVIIEETVSNAFEINAANAEDARKIAEDAYNDGLLVLEPGNLISKKMAVVSHCDEDAKWVDF